MKETRKHRTPAEIIAETENRLKRLKLKQAKKGALDNPEVTALMNEREEIQKDLREAKKILGSGPQSGIARIEKHEAWIENINLLIQSAEITEASAQSDLEELDQKIDTLIQESLKNSPDKSIEA
jgi:capsule polysaccharide export protein KpsE/RkpR